MQDLQDLPDLPDLPDLHDLRDLPGPPSLPSLPQLAQGGGPWTTTTLPTLAALWDSVPLADTILFPYCFAYGLP